MRPTERCGGRGQAPGTAGQTRESTASVDAPAEVGKQVAKTLHRRHLDESQRAIVAGRLANLPHGVRADHSGQLAAVTQESAAEMLNVSRPTESAQICAVTQTQAALTRLGEMLKAAPKNPGTRMLGGSIAEPPADVPTLADLATDKKVRL